MHSVDKSGFASEELAEEEGTQKELKRNLEGAQKGTYIERANVHF